MSEYIIERVQTFAEELLPSLALELVEIQFRREQHGWVLRVFIDSDEGITLDHCSRVSRELGDFLDVEDIIDHKYHLEVSSPGLERKLYKTDDFKRFRGRKAKIKMFEPVGGQKTFVGEIARVEDDTITLATEDGSTLQFTFDELSSARLAM